MRPLTFSMACGQRIIDGSLSYDLIKTRRQIPLLVEPFFIGLGRERLSPEQFCVLVQSRRSQSPIIPFRARRRNIHATRKMSKSLLDVTIFPFGYRKRRIHCCPGNSHATALRARQCVKSDSLDLDTDDDCPDCAGEVLLIITPGDGAAMTAMGPLTTVMPQP